MAAPFYVNEPSGVQTVFEGQGYVTGIDCFNQTAAAAFLQFFDAASAGDVTLGTTAPRFSIGIPSGGLWSRVIIPERLFSRGCMVAATTGVSNSTAPTYTDVDFPLTIDYYSK